MKTTTDKVWIVQRRGGMDFSSAARYGELRWVFDETVNPFDLKTMYDFARQTFQKEASPDDWLVLCGHLPAIVAAGVAFEQLYRRVNILVYHATKREYVKQELTFPNGNGQVDGGTTK